MEPFDVADEGVTVSFVKKTEYGMVKWGRRQINDYKSYLN